MDSEQRLDRIERILKLMVGAGLRARRSGREQDDKINIIVDYQIKNEERLQMIVEYQLKNEERFQMIVDHQLKNEERFQQNVERFARLADAQTHSDQKLGALIDIVRRSRHGRFST